MQNEENLKNDQNTSNKNVNENNSNSNLTNESQKINETENDKEISETESMLIDMGFASEQIKMALELKDDIEGAIKVIEMIQINPEWDFKKLREEVFLSELKMVIVARKDLKMTPGKLGAQVGHGALKSYKRAIKDIPDIVSEWEAGSCAKVVLRCNSQAEIEELQKSARELGLIAETIKDAGRTQIAPGSMTVCAIGPATNRDLKKVTGHLKLY